MSSSDHCSLEWGFKFNFATPTPFSLVSVFRKNNLTRWWISYQSFSKNTMPTPGMVIRVLGCIGPWGKVRLRRTGGQMTRCFIWWSWQELILSVHLIEVNWKNNSRWTSVSRRWYLKPKYSLYHETNYIWEFPYESDSIIWSLLLICWQSYSLI